MLAGRYGVQILVPKFEATPSLTALSLPQTGAAALCLVPWRRFLRFVRMFCAFEGVHGEVRPDGNAQLDSDVGDAHDGHRSAAIPGAPRANRPKFSGFMQRNARLQIG